MRTAFDFVIVFYLLSTFNGCSCTPACDSSSQSKVLGACTSSFSGSLKGGSTFFIDTGTGPNEQDNRCMCSLQIHTVGFNFVFQAGENIKQLNHSIEVGSHVLDSTVTRLNIVLSVDTDILIKNDGNGGVCVSVATSQSEGTFGVNCNSTQITTPTTTTSRTDLTTNIAQNKTSGTTELSSNSAAPYSPTYSSGEDKESLIGPVAGGVSGLVVLVAVTAIAIYCLRRKQKVQKEKSTRPDKSINDQANGDYTDMTGNPASVKFNSVDDDRAISLTEVTYGDVKLDRDAGNPKDKNKAAIKQTDTENNYHYASDKGYKTHNTPSSVEAIKSKEDFAMYTAVNKPPKLQAHINQNEENLAVYSAVNKPPKIQTYTTQDNIYDRTDSSDEKVRKMEDYNRIGAVQAADIATEDTYDSAATAGRNLNLYRDDYDTSYRIP